LPASQPDRPSGQSTGARPRPARTTGLKHLFAAGTYSIAGIRRLWAETAFRHEVLAAVAVLAGLAAFGASLMQILVAAILILLLIATEALNTALECIVDHVSPDWAEFARDAKDLGSLAVMCILLANGIWLVSIFVSLF